MKTICLLFLFVGLPAAFGQKANLCNPIPITFMQHSSVAPGGQQQFWSVVQNCDSKAVNYRFTVTLLREGKPVRVLASKSLKVPQGEAVTTVIEFTTDSIPGNYACLATATTTSRSGTDSAAFVVQ